MSTLKDIRYSIRTFARRPVFTAAILASLAFGIGANTAVFSVFDALMLRPLPVRDPGSLFQVLHSGDEGAFESSTYALYEHLKAHATTIEGAFQVDPTSMVKVLVDGRADSVVAQHVTGDCFSVLGIQPIIGDLIEPRDERGVARQPGYRSREAEIGERAEIVGPFVRQRQRHSVNDQRLHDS